MVPRYLGHPLTGSANVLRTRILVLGGDGMLGHLVRRHLAGDSAFAVDWTSRSGGAGSLFFDAKSPEQISQFAQDRGGYDYLINCIAVLKGPWESGTPEEIAEAVALNSVFPHQLASLAENIGARLIHVSTDAVFAPQSGLCRETDPPAPHDLYGRTKLLGEPFAEWAISIRSSVIGPNPVKKKGLVEWVLGQPKGATISGYDEQLWKGATTLQFAGLCAALMRNNNFPRVRAGSPHPHFCPNQAVTKFELVTLLQQQFRPDLKVEHRLGGTISRVLESNPILRDLWGPERPISIAIAELSSYIDRPHAP